MDSPQLAIQEAEKAAQAKTDASKHHDGVGGWLQDNVWAPAVNGSGVLQIYNTAAGLVGGKQAELPQAPAAKIGSAEWAVQTLSGAAGAIGPYVLAGKVAGKGMRMLGEELGVTGGTARFLANESAAQILGAGAYEALKKPNDGETRLGNAAGTMAGFGIFEGGNKLVAGVGSSFDSKAAQVAARSIARVGVGAVGGLAQYETAGYVSTALGEKDQRNLDGALSAMASGGFMNVALPAVQHGATRAIDFAYNSRSFGPGVPIGRQLGYMGMSDPELSKLAHQNPLARVKMSDSADGGTRADISTNRIHIAENSSAADVAHELTHLRLARQLDPAYKLVADSINTDPLFAEHQFYTLRAYSEAAARDAGARVTARQAGIEPELVKDPMKLGTERASNGQTYADNWRAEWEAFKQNPKYRPTVEFNGETPKDNAAPKENAAPNESTTAKPDDSLSAAEHKQAVDQGLVADSNEQKIITGPTVPDAIIQGVKEPLGATVMDAGTNFALKSNNASNIMLMVYPDATTKMPSHILPMFSDGKGNWSRFVPDVGEGATYLYRAFGPYDPAGDGSRFNPNNALLDTYAKAVTGDTPAPKGFDDSNPNDPDRHLRPGTKDTAEEMPRAVVVKDGNFDWQGIEKPNTPMSDSIIYELNLRAFTAADESIPLAIRGTYKGLVEKIPYLKDLGITAVELMPIHASDSADPNVIDPNTGKPQHNDWRYNTRNFMAPEGSLAADGSHGQQVNEFKYMVRELHRNGIEVILDVVYNHTGESNEYGPTFSFRGLDNKTYYMLKVGDPAKYENHAGTGNTLNVNEPIVQQMILDSLRYWVKEMGVDGFRFDLASVFKYMPDGSQQEHSPLIRAIENDPILSKVKLIAEPWSVDQYSLGHFSDRMWGEWNGVYRDTVRRFIKSDAGQLETLKKAVEGMPEWFDLSKGRRSINIVTVHDGFTMNDLVSYQEKHNWANGEQNRDGTNDNYSWNHGVEGPVEATSLPEDQKAAIQALRTKQMKNMVSMLMLSEGTPTILYGDEIRRTQKGNNNTWPQKELNNMPWDTMEQNADMHRFFKMMIDLRKQHFIGRLSPTDITWHGTEPFKPDFNEGARFMAWQYEPRNGNPSPLFQAFNAYWEPLQVKLPEGFKWKRVVDTSLPSGQDIVPSGQGQEYTTYTIQPRSAIVFEGEQPNSGNK